MRLTWVYGVPGVGKSATGWQVFRDLADDGVPCAYVDIDQLGMCFPARPDDPDRDRLKVDALAALAAVRQRSGCRELVVSGVLEPALRERRSAVLAPFDVVYCHLVLDDGELAVRLAARGVGPAVIDRVRREARDLGRARLTELVVDSGSARSVAEVAVAVRAAVAAERGRAVATGGVPPPSRAVSTTDRRADAVWLSGTRGAGKSTVAWEVFTRLWSTKATVAYLDVAQLGFVANLPDAGMRTAPGEALAAVWQTFREAGAQRLVVSGAVDGVVPDGAVPDGATYGPAAPARALHPTAPFVVHLHVEPDDLRGRTAARGRGEGVRLAGDDLLGRSPAELEAVVADALDRSTFLAAHPAVDVVVDTTGRTAADVTDEVLQRWDERRRDVAPAAAHEGAATASS